MKSILRTSCTFLLFLLTVFLMGCSHSQEPVENTDFFFDTTVRISIYDTLISQTKKEALLEECFSLCDTYEKMFSRTIVGSDIYQLNHANGETVTISQETAALIQKAISYSQITGGVFDCSIAPLSILWDFHNEAPVRPSDTDIQSALSHVDYQKILVDGTSVTLGNPHMALDLGGIAKGYIADKIKEHLAKSGVSSALINLGGNVLTLGSKPDASAFRIGIQRPFDPGADSITSAAIQNLSLVTSGVYERYFEEDGILYHHLLNPATGYPFENSLYSVTILCSSSADADALSTSCFGLGLEDGLELIESLDGTEALFITDDYELHYSSGFPQN